MVDSLPLWSVLLLSAIEVLALAFAAAVALWSLWPRDTAGVPGVEAEGAAGRLTSRAAPVLACLFVFAGGFAFALRAGASEPSLTPDTVCEAQVVNQCLRGDCHTAGIGSSVAGVVHGSAWNHLHILATWLGLSEGAFHVALHGLFGLAVLLLAAAGWSVGGPLVGALAAVGMAVATADLNIVFGMIYNHRGVPLAGALTTALLVVAARSGRLLPLALAAVVAAIGTNMHLLCGTLGVGIGLVGLAMPGALRERLTRTAVAGLVFLATLFGTSPAAWWSNLALLRGGLGAASSQAHPVVAVAPTWLLIGGLLALLALGLKVRRLRLPVLVGLAVVLPKLAFFEVARRSGAMVGDDKYLVEAAPAAALIAAALIGAAIARLPAARRRFLRPRVGRPWSALGLPVSAAVAAWALVVAPVRPADRGIDGLPLYSVNDAITLERYLRVERGWNPVRILAGFRASSEVATATLLEYFAQMVPQTWRDAGQFPAPPSGAPGSVLALAVPADRLTGTLPEGWRVLREVDGRALLVIEAHDWLDWTRFRFCVTTAGAAESCVETGFGHENRVNAEFPARLIGLPYVGNSQLGRTVVRVTFVVRLPPAPAARVLFAPHLQWRCGGRFVGVDAGASRLEDDGRRVVLAAAGDEPVTGTVSAEWRLGSDDCLWVVNGFAPWLLESSPEAVDRLVALLPEIDFSGRVEAPNPR